jgi:hypothetical protein
LKKKKREILEELGELKKEEELFLNEYQIRRRCDLLAELYKILEDKELYWFKRCHETWLLKGDSNTKYFHRIANGRKRKHVVYSLEDGLDHITGDEDLLKHATGYYGTLFGLGDGNKIDMDLDLWKAEDCVTEEENVELIKPFSMEEISKALGQMEKNKAAGQMVFLLNFFNVAGHS